MSVILRSQKLLYFITAFLYHFNKTNHLNPELHFLHESILQHKPSNNQVWILNLGFSDLVKTLVHLDADWATAKALGEYSQVVEVVPDGGGDEGEQSGWRRLSPGYQLTVSTQQVRVVYRPRLRER